ncbi:hypothetical protein C8R45DRAFT_1219917 [Mycena sanguinolenta]|nr:hypothetical protein C8R45DRAFT_1219917 [Mycena sanguinolenta]
MTSEAATVRTTSPEILRWFSGSGVRGQEPTFHITPVAIPASARLSCTRLGFGGPWTWGGAEAAARKVEKPRKSTIKGRELRRRVVEDRANAVMTTVHSMDSRDGEPNLREASESTPHITSTIHAFPRPRSFPLQLIALVQPSPARMVELAEIQGEGETARPSALQRVWMQTGKGVSEGPPPVRRPLYSRMSALRSTITTTKEPVMLIASEVEVLADNEQSMGAGPGVLCAALHALALLEHSSSMRLWYYWLRFVATGIENEELNVPRGSASLRL